MLMEDGKTYVPGWFHEIRRFSSSKPVFLLSGNVRDYYPFVTEKGIPVPYPLLSFLKAMLEREGYTAFLLYNPVDGFQDLGGAEDLLRQYLRWGTAPSPGEAFMGLRRMLKETRDRHVAVFVDYASRLVPDVQHLAPQDVRAFTVVEMLAHEVTPHVVRRPEDVNAGSGIGGARCNLLLFILQKENDLPSWLVYRNPGVRSIVIPPPHAEVRRLMAASFLNLFPDAQGLSPEERRNAVDTFVSRTEGMLLRDMQAIARLARQENLPVARLSEAVRRYKTGVREDPWLPLIRRIRERGRAVLDAHIKGQESIKTRVLQVLERAALGLSGAHLAASDDRPKGVFFFAGPTGVGKTQMAKAIAELVFGDPTAYVRFDMSEFGEPHTDQRLIGAPPGYVGYEEGGELTNAVRERPFSLLLFDEIEKAHPSIMDIFLQILDDGRLTDAKGETVYFGETLIVFTSNLGVYRVNPETGEKEPLVTPGNDYATVRERILEAVENYFRYTLARPEILNRIGLDNVLVFDFIRPEVARQIFDKFLHTFVETVRRRHGLQLRLRPETYRTYLERCLQERHLVYGGRGIAQAFEVEVINAVTPRLLEAKMQGQREVWL